MSYPMLHEELQELDLSESNPRLDLLGGVITTAIVLDLEVVVDISAGATSGTVVPSAIHDFITELTIRHDDRKLVDQLDGIELAEITRIYAQTEEGIQQTDLANGDVQTTTVRARYVIPCANPLLVNPFETAWALPPHKRQYQVLAKAGTFASLAAAIVTGGDRTVAVTSAKIRTRQHFQQVPAQYRPMYINTFRRETSKAITASVTNFELELRTQFALAALIILEMKDGAPIDSMINKWTLEYDGGEFFRTWEDVDVERLQLSKYPGQTAANRRAGVTMLDFLTGSPVNRYGNGRLGQKLDAFALERPRLTLDVTRTSGTEVIRAIHNELETIPGWTLGG